MPDLRAFAVAGALSLACGPSTISSLPSRSVLVDFEKDYSGKSAGDVDVTLGYDMHHCRGALDPSLHATFNGRPMSVFPGHPKGWYMDPCTGPGFRVPRIPSDKTAALSTVMIADRSMTITAEYDDLFIARSATTDAILRPGEPSNLAWTPASDRYVDALLAPVAPRIDFSYDGFSSDPNARRQGDPATWSALGTLAGGTLSVPVPADATEGAGTLRIQTDGDRLARRCAGAERCIAWPEERVITVHARVVPPR